MDVEDGYTKTPGERQDAHDLSSGIRGGVGGASKIACRRVASASCSWASDCWYSRSLSDKGGFFKAGKQISRAILVRIGILFVPCS